MMTPATRRSCSGWCEPSLEWKLLKYRDVYACRRAAGKAIPAAVEEVAAALDAATALDASLFQRFELLETDR